MKTKRPPRAERRFGNVIQKGVPGQDAAHPGHTAERRAERLSGEHTFGAPVKALLVTAGQMPHGRHFQPAQRHVRRFPGTVQPQRIALLLCTGREQISAGSVVRRDGKAEAGRVGRRFIKYRDAERDFAIPHIAAQIRIYLPAGRLAVEMCDFQCGQRFHGQRVPAVCDKKGQRVSSPRAAGPRC